MSIVTKKRSYLLRNGDTILPQTLIPLDNHLVGLPEQCSDSMVAPRIITFGVKSLAGYFEKRSMHDDKSLIQMLGNYH